MKLEVKVKGLDTVEQNIGKLARKYPEAGRRALRRNAEFIMTDAKMTYVPVDEGELRASGHVVSDETKLEVTLGFGGPAGIGNQGGETNNERVGYAIVQHEELDYSHRVGGAKYLERPLMAAIPRLPEDIGRDIREDIEGMSL